MTMTTKNSKDSNVLIIFENFFIGEYKLQHSRQLGEPCQRGAQLPVLWKNFLLEGSPGATHRDAPQGWNNDIFRDFVYKLREAPSRKKHIFCRLAMAMVWSQERGSR